MLSLLVPCYNEHEVLRLTYDTIVRHAADWHEPFELVFVDDGSHDDTWEIIASLAAADPRVRGVRLARNFGHQAAVGAGFEQATGDAVVILDADLQDPPSLVRDMLAKWREGYEVVYGQRNARHGESLFKKVTANLFYRLLDCVTDVPIPRDTGDFALLDARVVRELRSMREHALYWRGLRCLATNKGVAVRFDRPARAKGETKYTLRKMIRLASNAILSFSSLPLRLGTFLGGLMLAGTAVTTLGALGWFALNPSAGWPISATALVTLGVGSIQLLCLGMMGEYLSRIYDEVRDRPRWVVDRTVGFAAPAHATLRHDIQDDPDRLRLTPAVVFPVKEAG